METTVKRIFASVELECTPTCVRGTVSKEQAIDALANAGVKAILANDFCTFKETIMWARGVNLNYEQITNKEEKKEEKTTRVFEAEGEKDTLAKIAEILDNAPVTEEVKILGIIVKSLQQEKFSEVIDIAGTYDSESWLVSFEAAEEAILD
jgi:hypothetical protein